MVGGVLADEAATLLQQFFAKEKKVGLALNEKPRNMRG